MLRRGNDPVVTRGGATAFGVLIAIGAIVLAVPLLPGESAPREGDIAPRAFAAVHESEYVSEELTEAARREAVDAVEPVMASLEEVPEEQLRLIGILFGEVARLRLRTGLSSEERLEVLGESPPGTGLGQAIRSTLLTLGVADLEKLRAAAVEGVSVILSSPLREEDKRNRIEAYLVVGDVPSFPNGEGALRELLEAFVTPTVALDEEATGALREEARAGVEPVLVTYTAGELIARKGQTLDTVAVEALRETGVIREGFDYYDLGAGMLMGAALGAVLGVYLYRLQPFSRPAERRALMTLLAVLGTLVAVRVGLPQLLPDTEGRFFAYAMPVAAAAVVVSSVSAPRFGAIVAVVVALYAGFIAATAPPLAGAAFTSVLEPLELVIAYAAGGLAGAAAMQRSERLGRFAGAGGAVGAATGAVLLAFWLLTEQRETEGLGWLTLAATVAGGGSAVIGLGLHVLLSMALRVTTRMQLMELAQAGHPLLQELQEKAPGTFHHSMLVGTLAEQAANRIGADALLVRAGAYYHDIGKMQRPEYFVENNIERGVSPHDSLAPEASATHHPRPRVGRHGPGPQAAAAGDRGGLHPPAPRHAAGGVLLSQGAGAGAGGRRGVPLPGSAAAGQGVRHRDAGGLVRGARAGEPAGDARGDRRARQRGVRRAAGGRADGRVRHHDERAAEGGGELPEHAAGGLPPTHRVPGGARAGRAGGRRGLARRGGRGRCYTASELTCRPAIEV